MKKLSRFEIVPVLPIKNNLSKTVAFSKCLVLMLIVKNVKNI